MIPIGGDRKKFYLFEVDERTCQLILSESNWLHFSLDMSLHSSHTLPGSQYFWGKVAEFFVVDYKINTAELRHAWSVDPRPSSRANICYSGEVSPILSTPIIGATTPRKNSTCKSGECCGRQCSTPTGMS